MLQVAITALQRLLVEDQLVVAEGQPAGRSTAPAAPATVAKAGQP
jgi:hypothetical protein